MNKIYTILLLSFFLTVSCGEKIPDADTGEENTEQEGGNGQQGGEEQEPPAPQKPVFEKVVLMGAFNEEFSDLKSEDVSCSVKEDSDDFRYFPSYPSLSEKNTKILMMTLDPKDQPGLENGARVTSAKHTFYGSYSARVKLPDTRKAQANLGADAVLTISDIDKTHGLSQIEMEWKLADPTIVYMRATTGVAPEENTIERVVDIAKGNIIRSTYKSRKQTATGGYTVNRQGELDGEQNAPETLKANSSYDASSAFYIYGFDWYPESIVWWMKSSVKDEKTVLWEYKGKKLFPDALADDGVPALPSVFHYAFFHDKKNPVEGKTSAIQAPKFPFELELDWLRYEPFEDHIAAWQKEYFDN